MLLPSDTQLLYFINNFVSEGCFNFRDCQSKMPDVGGEFSQSQVSHYRKLYTYPTVLDKSNLCQTTFRGKVCETNDCGIKE